MGNLTVNVNDVVIDVSRPNRIAEGWQCGVVVRQAMPKATGWYPPTAVHPVYFANGPAFFRQALQVSRQVRTAMIAEDD